MHTPLTITCGGLHMLGMLRCASGEGMAMQKLQHHHGIPLEVPPLVDGVLRLNPHNCTGLK